MISYVQNKIKRTILTLTSQLIDRGYQILQDPKWGSGSVAFWKNPSSGVHCIVDITLSDHFIPPVRDFNIVMYRSRLEDFPKGESNYVPLVLDLPNLLHYFYRVDALPVGHYWEFVDEQSLSEQFVQARALLIEYGIRWLEDPLSNTEWVRDPTLRPR